MADDAVGSHAPIVGWYCRVITAPLKIGKHEWRIVVSNRTVRYQWRVDWNGAGVWNSETDWPRDLPAGLKRLYAINAQEIMEAMS